MRAEPNSYDAPYVLGIIHEYQNDLQGAKEWYEESLKKNPNYEQAKIRIEQLKMKISSGSAAGSGSAISGGTGGAGASGAKSVGSETVVQEGQLKQVQWFNSNMTFNDVVGMRKEKKLIYENIVLAIKKPELLRAYGKKLGMGVLFYGPPGCGKCLAPDSQVLLPDGRCSTIKKVVDDKEPYILTLTEKHELAVRKVSGWWKLDGKPLLRITTKSGRTVECTPEHPFLTKEGWKDAITLKEGSYIGVPKHIPVFGNMIMKESEVKLLAYSIAENGFAHESPDFTDPDPELLEDFVTAARQFDNDMHINTIIQNGDVASLQVSGRSASSFMQESRSMRQFLAFHGLPFTSPYEKRIPQAVFTLQKRLVALFLNRLFTVNGRLEDSQGGKELYEPKKNVTICYSNSSETIVRQIQHLLLRFGILSNIRKVLEDRWDLTIQESMNIDTFIEEIGMFGSKADFLLKEDNSLGNVENEAANSVIYEEIVKIKDVDAPEFVYDLTVDDTHNFVANDFFVHNTYFVRAIAGETNSNFIVAQVNQIVDMYAGNTEKNMHAIFEQARQNAPCIIFFDEIDSLGGKREESGGSQSFMKMAVNQFLQEMDGVQKNPEGIFVIGATNIPWDMDAALKRSGRIGEAIYIPPPDYVTRKNAIMYNTRKMPVAKGINYSRLARATIGFSQADIEAATDKAALLVAAEEDKTGRRRKITTKDILKMIKTQGSTLDEWYGTVSKEIISKKEVQTVDGKRTETIKEGKLSPEEKQKYKALINDVKKNTNPFTKLIKKFIRFFSFYIL
jgi:AAA+ superfamily predicted ATPase